MNWLDIRLLLVGLLALFLYSFTNTRNDEDNVLEIQVIFKEKEEYFVTTSEIHEIVENKISKISMITGSVLDLKNIEEAIIENALLNRVEAFLTIDNKLIIEAWQKNAIGRVVEFQESYYIDELGEKMPLSKNYSERVPMIYGEVNSKNSVHFTKLLELIAEDEFLREDIVGIVADTPESLKLISRSKSFGILFGGFDEMHRKLQNYKAFVQYMDNVSIEQQIDYKYIDLKFTQQVVCTK